MTTTLTDDELARIKRECLDNVLDFGATPYISVLSIYTIIRDHVVSSTVDPTTSSTAVTATGAAVLTLASVTGYVAGQRIVLDVDDARETVTIRTVSGSTVSVVCRYLHAGSYPVEVESPLTLVRGILSDLVTMEQAQRRNVQSLGLKRVDEVEWFGAAGEKTIGAELNERRMKLRMELAEACGIGWVVRQGMARRAGGSVEVY